MNITKNNVLISQSNCQINIEKPVTLVRFETPDSKLKIELIFNENISLNQPSIPLLKKEANSIYSWNIQTNVDKTLSVQDSSGTNHKMQSIWWDAIRKIKTEETFQMEDSTRIDKEELSWFLHSVLSKMGVSPEEQIAFTHYWQERFNQDESVRYVQVRLTTDEEIKSILPEMKVSSEQTSFDLSRVYFQFTPVPADTTKLGLSESDFLAKVAEKKIGANAVIDLGGEILGAEVAKDPDFQEMFINGFIKG